MPKSNHNNNATASIKPMMPLNNNNAANSKTPSNGMKGKHHAALLNNPCHQHGLSAGFRN
jgi:hypothetical protein